MNSQIEPTLERIPGQKPELEEEKKENKEPQINITTPEKDLRKTAPPLTIDQPKLEKQKVTSTTETKESKLYKKLKEKGRLKDRKNSYVFAPSILFLKPFDVIDESILKSGEKPKVKLEDLSLGNNIIDNEESSEMDNVKSLYEYNNIKEEKDPIKKNLKNQIENLRRTQNDIMRQFKHDKQIYKKRIEILEKACKAKVDENKLKNLKKINEDNKKQIKNYKEQIQRAELDNIEDKKKFNESLKNILDLKAQLIAEIKELQILAKHTNFIDYNDFAENDRTKIEKINFRPNDSRYLLTNEYETSREEEESFSSYDKLNKINNTPEGFDINKQNIYLNKTVNNFINNKNNKLINTVNSFNNDKNINIKNNTFNKGTEGNISIKNIEMKQKNNNNININDSINSNDNNINIEINKNINNNNININTRNNLYNQNNNKRIYPKDPDFISNDMILLSNMDQKDSDFY